MSEKKSVFQRINNVPYGYTNPFQLFDATKNSRDIIQRLRLQVKIPAHNGCVNSICWNETGKLLLSGSDDQHLCITDAYSHSVLAYIQTGHKSNIFCAKFLPNTGDHKVISCSGDGVIIYSDLETPETSMQNKFTCHYGTAYEITTVPNDPNTFLSCGEDGNVRWFDLRTKNSCVKENCKEDILIDCTCGVTSLAINPVQPFQLALGCADSSVRVFDRRMIGTQATGSFTGKGMAAMIASFTTPLFTHPRRITSLAYSRDGQEMLVSYSSDFVYLFDLRNSFQRDLKRTTVPEKNGKGAYNPTPPLMKRLRVRGDWSDTGPHARPESENQGDQHPRTLHANLMQRMSDVLTSMYNHRGRNPQNPSHPSSSSHSDESEIEDTDENAEDDQVSVNVEARSPSILPQSEAPENHTQGSDNLMEAPENQFGLGRASPILPSEDIMLLECNPIWLPDSSQRPIVQSGVDLTTIKVEPPSDIQSSSVSELEETQTSETKVLNLSLQNVRHEMSLKKELSNEEVKQSVISDVGAMDAVSASGEKNSLENVSSSCLDNICPSSSMAGTEDEPMSPTDSTLNNCDKTGTSAFSPSSNSSTDALEAFNSSDNEVQAGSNVASNTQTEQVNDVFVTSTLPHVQFDGSTASMRERQRSRNDESEVALMMQMEPWVMESEGEDTRSPPSSPSILREPETMLKDADELRKLEEDEAAYNHKSYMEPEIIRKFVGHRNARTMIKECTFWGDNFIMSGSDCGHIFIWDRHTAELVMLMEADHHVVNCLQPHPFDPILASSGIDYDIKIWAPLQEEPAFDEEKANELMKRNKVMLEETKDTITVPASFMIRMLASLNHLTTGIAPRRGSGWRRVARQLREEYRSRNNR